MFTKFTFNMFKTIPIYFSKDDDADNDDNNNSNDVDEGDDDEEQGSDDENDLLVLFGSLGKQLKTFQRDLTRTDKKVESAKKASSPLWKKRRKRR